MLHIIVTIPFAMWLIALAWVRQSERVFPDWVYSALTVAFTLALGLDWWLSISMASALS